MKEFPPEMKGPVEIAEEGSRLALFVVFGNTWYPERCE